MTDTYRYGILSGGIGSFDSIQWTNNVSGGTQTEILDSSRNLTNITSLSASSFVSASSFEVDGQASISYDSSALDFSNGGAGAKLSTSAFSASVQLQGASVYTTGMATLSGGVSASSVAVADLGNTEIVFAGAGGELQSSNQFTFDGSDLTIGSSTFGSSTVIAGNLTVQGTTTTVNSTEVTIADKALVVASGSSDAEVQSAGGAGIKAQSESGASFLYDGVDSWDASENMNLASGKSFNISDANMLDADGAAKVRSAVAGDGLGHSAGVLAVNVDDSSIEIDSDSLQIKALGVTNAMLAGGIASSKIAELNNFDTGDLAEGSNLYYTNARARAAISGTDNGGDGSFSYNQSTGEISYTGPSSSEVRAHFSNGNMLDYSAGQFSVNASAFSASWDAAMAADDTDSLAEGSTNQYYLDSRARAAVSVTDNGGDGSLSYDSGSGVISYTGPSAAETRAHFSGAAGIDLTDGAIAVNVDDAGIEINADTLRLKSTAIAATANETTVAWSAGQFTIGLPDDVTIGNDLTVSNDVSVSNALTAQSLTSNDSLSVAGTGSIDYLDVNAGAVFAGAIDMGSNRINNLTDPSNAQDAATKAYVDAQLTATSLEVSGGSGSGSIDLDSQTLTIAGTSNEIETSFSGQTLTIGLPDSVTITSDLTVNGNTNLGNDQSVDSVTFNAQLLAASTNVDIGSDANRFGDVYATNVYTGDFHMKNERGDWTLFEESDHIRIRNNATGQEFKLDMTPVEE
jgi:hypothetical protein